jgi:predicted DCC family thiol-disulfide oxidoreductase YuxK
MHDDGKLLLLFDGVCNFCNDTVLFVIDRDPNERVRFAPLQSDVGQQLLLTHGLGRELTSSVLIENGRAYTRSDGALRLIRALRWPWPLLYAAVALPRFVRDAVYDLVAARRYLLFGKSESCRIPTPELRRRFVG